MNGENEIKLLFAVLVGNLPTVLACAVAIIVVLVQSRQIPRAVPWALVGFGLMLLLSVVLPFVQASLPSYMASRALSYKEHAWMFTALALVGSTLHAAVLIFLLVAVLAGRAPAALPPPLPRG